MRLVWNSTLLLVKTEIVNVNQCNTTTELGHDTIT
jgi:hypothetical protein